MPKFDTQHIKRQEDANRSSTKEEMIGKFNSAIEELSEMSSGKVDAFPQTKTAKVALSVDAKYSVTGKYSGRNYLFNGAGSTQDVEEKDVEFLLSLRQGERQCCGGTEAGNKIFVLV